MATIPAWTCPKCGATHPITVDSCCKPVAVPSLPVPKQPEPPIRIRPPKPYEVPFQPGIIPAEPWPRPFNPRDFPRGVPQWWTWPPDITCSGSNP